jgi:pre-mRNA-splicing factor 38A
VDMRRARSEGGESDEEDRDTKRRRYSPSSSRGSSPDLRGRPRTRSSSVSSAGSRFMSRSPSRSGSEGEEGDTRGRYISRSPSISPDRALAAEDDDKLDGDV